MKIIEAFTAWLEKQGYQPSTVQSTVRIVKRAEKSWRDGERIDAYAPYLKRLVSFADETGVREEFITAVAELFSPVEASPTGANRKPALSDEQWRELGRTLDPNDTTLDPYDVALSVLLRTRDPGVELQELVQMPLASLEQRDMPSDARKRVRDLRRASIGSLLSLVCPGGTYDCAYKRLSRRLTARGRALQLELDFHNVSRTPWEVRML